MCSSVCGGVKSLSLSPTCDLSGFFATAAICNTADGCAFVHFNNSQHRIKSYRMQVRSLNGSSFQQKISTSIENNIFGDKILLSSLCFFFFSINVLILSHFNHHFSVPKTPSADDETHATLLFLPSQNQNGIQYFLVTASSTTTISSFHDPPRSFIGA